MRHLQPALRDLNDEVDSSTLGIEATLHVEDRSLIQLVEDSPAAYGARNATDETHVRNFGRMACTSRPKIDWAHPAQISWITSVMDS